MNSGVSKHALEAGSVQVLLRYRSVLIDAEQKSNTGAHVCVCVCAPQTHKKLVYDLYLQVMQSHTAISHRVGALTSNLKLRSAEHPTGRAFVPILLVGIRTQQVCASHNSNEHSTKSTCAQRPLQVFVGPPFTVSTHTPLSIKLRLSSAN